MSDQKHFINSNLYGTDKYFRIYSDKTFKTLDVIRELGLQLSTNPLWLEADLTAEVELSSDLIITTATGKGEAIKAARLDAYRSFTIGNFTSNKSGQVGGSATGAVNVLSDGSFTGKIFANPIPLKVFNRQQSQALIEKEAGTPVTSLAQLQRFLPSGWQQDPFSKNLISATNSLTTQESNGNTGEASRKSANLSTTPELDRLTGVAKRMDTFRFDVYIKGQNDIITGLKTKEDRLFKSQSAFEASHGTFAIAANGKKLAKQLGTNVDIIYHQKTGELILNANGAEPGYGVEGGVFAVLIGRPTVAAESVQFY